jgi:hypothetical protein
MGSSADKCSAFACRQQELDYLQNLSDSTLKKITFAAVIYLLSWAASYISNIAYRASMDT